VSEHILDAEVVEMGAEVVPTAAVSGPVSLFRTDDPAEVLKRAKATADALAPVIRDAGMVVTVSGKDYLTVEAWQTLGQQVGVTGVIVATRKLSEPDGWEARCEARTLDGRVIGAADSMCLRTEERWKDGEEFELRSMAQTRSMSRALASVLRFIPTLAGMGGTPAEEMDRVRSKGGGGSSNPSTKQVAFLERLAKEAGFQGDELNRLMAYAGTLSKGEVSKRIEGLKADGEARTKAADKFGIEAKEWAEGQSDVPGDGSDFGASNGGGGEDVPF
jgi:uncharacterized protein YihD (DUF1040 family)